MIKVITKLEVPGPWWNTLTIPGSLGSKMLIFNAGPLLGPSS